MEVIVIVALCFAFAAIFRNAIKSYPALFYTVAALLAILVAGFVLFRNIPGFARPILPLIQRCLLAFGLFTVVMFIGVFPEKSPARKHLAPIRGELSIMAAILTVGHIVGYLSSYLPQMLAGFASMSITMIASFAVSFTLVILLIPLTTTSFHAVRKAMDIAAWKRLQILAYPFFILIFLHIALILIPSVSTLGQRAFSSIVVYTGIVLAYGILRLRKAWLDRSTQKAADGEALP